MFSAKISKFKSATNPNPVSDITVSDFLESIKSGQYQAQIESLRKLKGAAYESAKKRLPAVTLSGRFSKRNNKSLVEHSGFLQIDIDGKDNNGYDPVALRSRLVNDSRIAFLFDSPGGDIKAGIRIDPVKHLESFKVAETYFKKNYGVIIDKAVKDVSRLCFVSFDPACHVNESVRVFEAVKKVISKPPKKAGLIKSGPFEWTGNIDDLPVKPTTKALILDGVPKGQRSEAIMTVLNALVFSNLSDAEIIDVFERYPIGEKYREKGQNRTNWLNPQIAKARARITDRAKTKRAVKGPSRKKVFPTDKEAFGLSDRVLECLTANEDGDAWLFQDTFAGQFIFDHAAAEWYVWRGHYWELDKKDEATRAIQSVLKIYADEANSYAVLATTASLEGDKDGSKVAEKQRQNLLKRVRELHTKHRKSNVLYLSARVGDSLSMTGEEWDKNSMLLGFRNGVVDLTTGTFRSGKQTDFIKTVAPHEWTGIDTPCPTWEKFLDEIFQSNADLIAYIQRLLGYGITGKTIYHIHPILWGQGRNGKGTLIETARYCLGDLAFKTNAETLLDSGHMRASGAPDADTLALRGKRIVWASETNEGRRLNTGKLKELVGGDTLNARAPFGRRPVTFEPTHLLLLLTNNKPHAPASDYALWERLHLIEFGLSFVNRKPVAPNERPSDPDLFDKLKSEASGILAWLVRGCLEWQRVGGLYPPDCVVKWTQEYRDDQDIMGAFIADCLYEGSTAEARANEVYSAYKEWCLDNGHRPLSNQKFGRELTKRYDSYKDVKGKMYIGIGIGIL